MRSALCGRISLTWDGQRTLSQEHTLEFRDFTQTCCHFVDGNLSVSLQVVIRYDPGRGHITALTVTPEECILAGTVDGSMLVFAPDPRRTISKRINLADRKSGASSLHREAVATIRFDS